MTYTTLNKIKACEPCASGWKRLLTHLGKTKSDDNPLSFLTILESNGLDDTLWCCRAAPEHDREWRLFAVWCVRQVQHLMLDKRSIEALDVAERFANGRATSAELRDAWARSADAAWSAEVAARSAADAARSVVGVAAWSAAGAAWSAADAADGRAAAAERWDASARSAGAARSAVMAAAQTIEFKRVLEITL